MKAGIGGTEVAHSGCGGKDNGKKRPNSAGLKVSTVQKEQEPKELLCHEAEALIADCIFVGARGMGRLERLLIGSVSLGVASRAHCSVEVVRSGNEA